MVQNKLALFLSKYEPNATSINILERAGLKDINPINYNERGAMRIIFSHDPENVIVIWDDRYGNPELKEILSNEGYKTISYNEIKDAVKVIIKVEKIFEAKTED